MKKLILFFARGPVFSVSIALILCVLAYIATMILAFGFSSEMLISTWIAWCLAAMLGAMLMAVSRYTTFFSDDEDRAVIIYDGDVITLYQKPLWGKYDYRIMRFPKNWRKVEHGFDVRAELHFEVMARDMIFPFLLSFDMSCKLSAEALDTIIMMQEEVRKKYFNLDDCIRTIFIHANFNEQEVAAIEEIAEGIFISISDKQKILDDIEQKIYFPSILFFDQVKIMLLRNEIKSTLFDKEEHLNFV